MVIFRFELESEFAGDGDENDREEIRIGVFWSLYNILLRESLN